MNQHDRANISAMVEQAERLCESAQFLVLLSEETAEAMRTLTRAQRLITMASSQRYFD
jgi:hypothetical protein